MGHVIVGALRQDIRLEARRYKACSPMSPKWTVAHSILVTSRETAAFETSFSLPLEARLAAKKPSANPHCPFHLVLCMHPQKTPLKPGLASLAERLRKARQEAGFKRFEDAAKKACISVNTLKSYEYGKFVPSALNLAALAKAYQVTTDWLLGMSNHPKGLPAGKALVDLETAEAILAARTREELLPHLSWHPPITQCIRPIPTRGEILSLKEAMSLSQRLVAKINRLAPDLAEKWEAFENDLGS